MLLKDGTTYIFEESDVANWRRGYPTLDVDQEIAKMAMWSEANPSKRKTRTGIRKFVVSWLNRASEKGGSLELPVNIEDVPQAVRRDDVIHKLRAVFQFYNKTLDRETALVWLRGLKGYSEDIIVAALEDYQYRGRYAPKPVDVMEICEEHKQRIPTNRTQQQEVKQAPKHIAKAWMWYISNFQTGKLTGQIFRVTEVDDETAEQYLNTVNEETAKYGNWDAIQLDHVLPQYRQQAEAYHASLER